MVGLEMSILVSELFVTICYFPAGQSALPTLWMNMNSSENLKKVTLTMGKEFSEVDKLFQGQVKNGLYTTKQPNRPNLQIQKVGCNCFTCVLGMKYTFNSKHRVMSMTLAV